jgi:cytochrome c556
MRRVAMVAAALAGVAVFTTGAFSEEDPIKARKALMKDIVGPSAKLGGQMIKGDVPFDAAKASEAMTAIQGVPDKYVLLFPEGTGMEADPETEASPRIWEDFDGFTTLAMKLKDEAGKAVAAAQQGEGAFRAAFTDLTKNCKNCHESFRVKRE